ncbi:hypothetical protein L1987_55187 [Smallanthus sonchifolius]|uniref:Uncharacterized protein n=1 Tax=Smallanthus sonchifolius TaxID=185202 RepID=A0ACB9E9N1_9ASTR|nr:hypothetical protein L1987_55187 [Smallanthus sonchifolius]
MRCSPVPSLELTFKDRVFGGRRMKIEHLEHLYNEDLSHIMDDDMVRLSLLVLQSFRPKAVSPNEVEQSFRPKAVSPNEVEQSFRPKAVSPNEVEQSFRPKAVSPNEVEVDEEWWVESSKRKWSSLEVDPTGEPDDPTGEPDDHDEEEAINYGNEMVVEFNLDAADTLEPSVEIVDRPKRIKKPSSNVLSTYIVFKKTPRKTNRAFDVKKS